MSARLAGAAVACGALLAGCGGGGILGLPEGDAYCVADSPYYRSVPELVRASDLIVVAVPSKQQDRSIAYGDGTSQEHRIWSLEVQHVLRGEVPPSGPLEVKQMSCSDEPRLRQGEPQLLFLGTYPDSPGMPASLINPTQGLYLLDDAGSPQPIEDNSLRPGLNEVEQLSHSVPVQAGT